MKPRGQWSERGQRVDRQNPRRLMPVYLVSGAEDIVSAVGALQSRGRAIVHDNDVHDEAHEVLREGPDGGRHFVVVAHGSKDGTIRWHKTGRGTSELWLWVGMPNPPQQVRIYLYCCHVGIHLPGLLGGCEAFGHVDRVPIPADETDALILDFLDQVDALMQEPAFDAEGWRQHLIGYVQAAYAAEVEVPTALLGAPTLLLLLRSLGYGGG
jgi:hypothetical protein